MHIHWKRTLIAFSLAGLGVLVLAIRPALQSNEFSVAPGEKSIVTYKLSPDEFVEPFSINAVWDLLDSPEYAYYRLAAGAENPFDLLKTASLPISVIQDEQSLSVALSSGELQTLSHWDKAKIKYYSFPMGRVYKERADGSNYACFSQHIIVKLEIERSFFATGLEGYILVQVMVDPQKKTIDAIPFNYYVGRSEYSYSPAGSLEGCLQAPSRYGNDPIERALRKTVEAISEVDYPSKASMVASRLEEKLALLAKMRPHPERPWPSSWGSHQHVAKELREVLSRAVILSKELDYFDSPKWQKFLESQDFFFVFGDVVSEEGDSFNY